MFDNWKDAMFGIVLCTSIVVGSVMALTQMIGCQRDRDRMRNELYQRAIETGTTIIPDRSRDY